ncbi:hypothetical protein [Rhizobium giardinii]|uniref:hypothetical protein n=1 Tax=Rhizobium giardinii TaxID=56731 RepID=UPI003D6EB001
MEKTFELKNEKSEILVEDSSAKLSDYVKKIISKTFNVEENQFEIDDVKESKGNILVSLDKGYWRASIKIVSEKTARDWYADNIQTKADYTRIFYFDNEPVLCSVFEIGEAA